MITRTKDKITTMSEMRTTTLPESPNRTAKRSPPTMLKAADISRWMMVMTRECTRTTGRIF